MKSAQFHVKVEDVKARVHAQFHSVNAAWDSLQLAACPARPATSHRRVLPEEAKRQSDQAAPPAVDGHEVFVSPEGSDATGTGAVEAPFMTPQRGVKACRVLRRTATIPGSGSPCTVTLRSGTYRLTAGPLLIEQWMRHRVVDFELNPGDLVGLGKAIG